MAGGKLFRCVAVSGNVRVLGIYLVANGGLVKSYVLLDRRCENICLHGTYFNLYCFWLIIPELWSFGDFAGGATAENFLSFLRAISKVLVNVLWRNFFNSLKFQGKTFCYDCRGSNVLSCLILMRSFVFVHELLLTCKLFYFSCSDIWWRKFRFCYGSNGLVSSYWHEALGSFLQSVS